MFVVIFMYVYVFAFNFFIIFALRNHTVAPLIPSAATCDQSRSA